MEKEGFAVSTRFIQTGISGILIFYDNTDFYIEEKMGASLFITALLWKRKNFFHRAYQVWDGRY